MLSLPIDQLREHPRQSELFQPLSGRAWEDFYSDINTRGMQYPVVVSDRTGDFVITDGHQRVRAAKHLGWLEVPCVMGEFANEPEEVRCLVMNNVQRRQLDRQEIEAVIKYWLKAFTDHSNRRIADEIGVDHKTVESKRVELEGTGEIPQLDKLEGKDGKIRPRTQPRRESRPENAAISYPEGNKSAEPRPPSVSAVPDTNPHAEQPEEFVSNVDAYSGSSDQTPQPEVLPKTELVAPPPPAPGWQPTETRKELERAATILTRLDADEAREEMARDRLGTLRPFVLAAYKQLGEMLEVETNAKLITVS